MQEPKTLQRITLYTPFVLLGLFIIGTSIPLLSPARRTTVDDSQFVQSTVLGNRSGEVLGASSKYEVESNLCPSHTPIMGWIDYRGNKLIVEFIQEDENVSACFATIAQAEANGFFQRY